MASGTETHVLTAEDRAVRGYSWPPFEKGNQAALKHGAYSEQLASEKVAEISLQFLQAAPWLDSPEYRPAVARYLRAEAVSVLSFAAIERIAAAEGAERVPKKLWQAWNAATNTAARQGSLLGLDPMSRQLIVAAREADRQGSRDRLIAEGRAIRRQQETDQATLTSRGGAPDDDPAG